MEASAQPVAKARIDLSEDDRKRIAKELGLDEYDFEAVPDHLDIARYDDVGEDVSGFLFQQLGGSSLSTQQPTSSLGGSVLGTSLLRNGGILVPV